MTNLTRHNVVLFKGQLERLQSIYTSRSASEVIRKLIQQHILQVEQKLKEKASV